MESTSGDYHHISGVAMGKRKLEETRYKITKKLRSAIVQRDELVAKSNPASSGYYLVFSRFVAQLVIQDNVPVSLKHICDFPPTQSRGQLPSYPNCKAWRGKIYLLGFFRETQGSDVLSLDASSSSQDCWKPVFNDLVIESTFPYLMLLDDKVYVLGSFIERPRAAKLWGNVIYYEGQDEHSMALPSTKDVMSCATHGHFVHGGKVYLSFVKFPASFGTRRPIYSFNPKDQKLVFEPEWTRKLGYFCSSPYLVIGDLLLQYNFRKGKFSIFDLTSLTWVLHTSAPQELKPASSHGEKCPRIDCYCEAYQNMFMASSPTDPHLLFLVWQVQFSEFYISRLQITEELGLKVIQPCERLTVDFKAIGHAFPAW